MKTSEALIDRGWTFPWDCFESGHNSYFAAVCMPHSDVSIWRFKTLKASSLSFAALALHFALHLKNTISCSRAPADVRRRLHFYVSRELKNCRDVKSSSSIIKSLWARAWRNWLKVSGAALNCLCYMYRSDIRSITASTDSCFCTLTHPNNHKFLPGNWNNIFWSLAGFVCSLQIPRGWKWRN